MTEDEMVGWHHRLYGYEFEQAPGAGDGQDWRAAVHRVAKSCTGLSDCTEQRGHSFRKLTPKVLSTHLLIRE